MTQYKSSNQSKRGAGSWVTALCCALLLPGAALAADASGQWGAAQPVQQQARPAQGAAAATSNWSQGRQTGSTVRPALGQTRAGVGTNVGAGFNTNVGTGPAKQAMPTGVNGKVIGSQSNGNFANQAPGQKSGLGYAASHGANAGPNGQNIGYGHASGGGAGGPDNQVNGSSIHQNNGGNAGASWSLFGGSDSDSKPAPKNDHGFSSSSSSSSGGSSGSGSGPDPNRHVVKQWVDPKKGGNKMGADMGAGDGGGGVLVNGNGNVVNPGHRTGSDAGGGRGQTGASSGGAPTPNAANGGYVNVGNKGGGDAPLHKPVEIGPMRSGIVDKGNVDPKRGGGAAASVTAVGH